MSRRIALLINPSSGRGQGMRIAAEAVPRLRDAGHEVEDLRGRDADEARDLVHDCVERGIDTVAVVGGDGMVHVAIQALAGSGTRLGLLPAGTGNDVARYLDVPRGDTAAAVDVVIGGRERTIDLARAGATYFLTVLAAGFDAVVNERANRMRRPRGQMRYNLATLAELRTLRPIDYVLELDGEEQRLAATVVAVGNGPSFGGGLRITEGAELDDGLLDVVVIEPLSRRELVRTYPKLFRGTHVHHPGYHHHRVRSVTVAAAGITAYADGERIGPLPLTVDVVPAALRVLVGR
ncbi:diacylglycerol kinase [Nocardioides aurantiacus]|uniref:Diacylglycerol kinase n=1 Tax=Nocardioides aurantiacus TaxID=86796 RepID=A0A3N2CT51_9ACTN|nr:diacylglycerol kinase [Nocardioides aurantiacus]ROR90721.1 diacylglycerol kinase [Nocardioides aurantiacus]